ncbi:integrator complex subunit 5-like isoform X2 [Tubulanus polymorphus]|uniref:integrator complex subunit 5-like isoform X2 n=1 Tax=Tubulanus polymorphus TaxID=672921 RepID=UPI003DA5695C
MASEIRHRIGSAAEQESFPEESVDPREILAHVRKFVSGAGSNQKGQLKNNEDLAKSAIFLLQTLPSARFAVLEHLCSVFDQAVQAHILRIKRANAFPGSNESLDSIIHDVHRVLLKFIKCNPEAWSPIISTWSLKLLGMISSKNSNRAGIVAAQKKNLSNLNESLQLWMTCKATMALVEISTECFASMISSSPDICVDALLEASVVHSPHFDWVVAHIGSCFPTTIITRVLMCGLKDFCHHNGKDKDSASQGRKLQPKMATVVGILGHLAAQHGQDIKKALLNLFEESLKSDDDVMHLSTIPFLLQLASMSAILLKVITNEFVHTLTPDVLNQLGARFAQTQNTVLQDKTSLLDLAVQLVIKTDVGALKVIQFLLKTAAPEPDSVYKINDTVRRTCATILDSVTMKVYGMTQRGTADCDIPLLYGVESHTLDLCQNLLDGSDLRSKWLTHLLVSLAAYCGESCAAAILAYGYTHSVCKTKLGLFVKLQKEMETRCAHVLTTAIGYCMETIGKGEITVYQKLEIKKPIKRKRVDTVRLLMNLLTLAREEKRHKCPERANLQKILQKHLLTLASLLTSQRTVTAIVTIQILDVIGLPDACDMSQLIELCGAVVTFFFQILALKDFSQKSKAAAQCNQYLQKLSRLSPAMNVILRFLMDGVFMQENSRLFGAKVYATDKAADDTQYRLASENQNLASSVTIPQSHSSVFHAGVIGHGLKRPPRSSIVTKDQQVFNRQLLVRAMLTAGSKNDRKPALNTSMTETDEVDGKPASTCGQTLSAPAAHVLASALVQQVTSDVLYNDIVWPAPDLQLMKQTVERDLQIKKRFEDHPVLWDILDLVSTSKSGLVICSCILRSLTATLIQYWDASRGNSTRNAPWYLDASCKVIEALKKGDILREPVCYISEIFHLITPYQLHLLLFSVWEFLFQCPEVLDCEFNSGKSNIWTNDSRICQLCRSIIHGKVETLGAFYGRFFPVKSSTNPSSSSSSQSGGENPHPAEATRDQN